jgi:hypothetical protein
MYYTQLATIAHHVFCIWYKVKTLMIYTLIIAFVIVSFYTCPIVPSYIISNCSILHNFQLSIIRYVQLSLLQVVHFSIKFLYVYFNILWHFPLNFFLSSIFPSSIQNVLSTQFPMYNWTFPLSIKGYDQNFHSFHIPFQDIWITGHEGEFKEESPLGQNWKV